MVAVELIEQTGGATVLTKKEALQSTNRKFARRFESMESRVRESGRNVDQLTLEEMDALWDEAKAAER